MFFVTVLSDNFTVQLHNKIGVRKSNGVSNYVSVQMFKRIKSLYLQRVLRKLGFIRSKD